MVISDKPTKTDLFGFEPYVKGIADLVRQTKPDDLPISIGIYGAWGSGKTSFLMQLEDQLQKEVKNSIPTVWFEAWKYDRTDDVRSALIYTVLANLHTKANGQIQGKIKNGFEKIFEATKTLALNTQIGIGASGISVTLPTGGQVIDDIDKAEKFRTSIDCLADGFKEAVSAYLEQYSNDEQKKLIIFVDDLDRCLPEHVIIVLEALKLFLDRAPCIFVIAIDRTVVEKAIQNHYGSDPGICGRDYLDKIVQYPFTIPTVSSSQLRSCFEKLINPDDISEKCSQIFTRTAEGNPRIYLRLINSWRLYSSLAPHVIPALWGDKSKRHVLAIAVALHLRWPDLHELGRNNPKGLITLTEYCMNHSNTLQIEKALTNSNAIEYLRFWNNGSVRNFLNSLTMVGKGTGEVFVSEEVLKASLELSSRGS
jgi:hypothetical protein